MIKILITGGCGFLGTNFILHLLNLKKKPRFRILNIDILSYYSNTYLARNIKDCYFFQKGDITQQRTLEKMFKEFLPTITINFAAQTHVDRSFFDTDNFIKTNILGVHNLFILSRKYGVKKFIHISTDEVFGEKNDDNYTMEESRDFNPTNPYSASKTAAEILLFALTKSFSYPAIIVRTNNNYGPFQYPEKLIPLSILLLLKNQKVPLYGDGRQRRRWLYVEDFCKGLEKITFSEFNSGIFHLGTNVELENREVVKQICMLLNKEDDCIRFVKDRPSHDRCYSLNFSATSKILHWEPQTPFKEGLKKTIEWYLNNSQWLEKIAKSSSYAKFMKKQYNIIVK